MDSEAIERAALADLHAAADGTLRQQLDLQTQTVEGVFISIAANLAPSSLVVNRTLGLDDDTNHIAQVVQAYERVGFARPFVALDPSADPASTAAHLASHGYRRVRSWMKFSRGTEPLPEAATTLRVAEIGPDHGTDFASTVADAFDLGTPAIPWLARLPGRPDWRIYMSFDGDQPAGVGALYIAGDTAWCDWAATKPSHRRRGSQTAIMHRRLRDALASGIREIFTCTGEDAPGDSQHSYNNIRKMGFREKYLRPNFAPTQRQA